jgi:oxygen-independent coproporphyrinogen-3 oxidase
VSVVPRRASGLRTTDHRPRTTRSGVGLYVHLPFCASHCAYCTFVTTTDLALLPRALAAVAREIEGIGARGARLLRTLYLGGGTPSLVPEEQLREVFAAINRRFRIAPGAEVTLEANPDDVTPERAAAWLRLGVTRVSVGVQSFSDGVLATLNRRHSAAQATAAVELLQREGFEVSLDLMLGLPGMSAEALDFSLAEVVRLRPGHVSIYLLEMDKPHALARLAERRPDLFPDSDTAARQYLAAGRTLLAQGYYHYEVSNFALPGHAARHNLRYWRCRPVLAVGVSAHGQSGRMRWANVDDLPAYLAAVESGRTPRAWSRQQGDAETIKERAMLGLRLAAGVPDGLAQRAGKLAPAFAARLDDFLALGLARTAGARVRLTPRGWLVSNELFAALW